MKDCDIFRGSKHTLTPPTYFPDVKTANPRIYASAWTPRVVPPHRDIYVYYTSLIIIIIIIIINRNFNTHAVNR